MPQHVIELTTNAFEEIPESLSTSHILILGVSYKPNVKDIQLTPAEEIIKKLQEKNVIVHIYDPYFTSTEVFGIVVEKNIEDIISKVDATIIVTAHNEFKKLDISLFKQMKHPILIDTRGIIDPLFAKEQKLIFRGLGRGE